MNASIASQTPQPMCQAKRRNGDDCPHFAIPGLGLCRVHGGGVAKHMLKLYGIDPLKTPVEALEETLIKEVRHLLSLRAICLEAGVSTTTADQSLRAALEGESNE